MLVKAMLGCGLATVSPIIFAARLAQDHFLVAVGSNGSASAIAVGVIGLLSLGLIASLVLFRRLSRRSKFHSLLAEFGWGVAPLILLWALLLPVISGTGGQHADSDSSDRSPLVSHAALGSR